MQHNGDVLWKKARNGVLVRVRNSQFLTEKKYEENQRTLKVEGPYKVPSLKTKQMTYPSHVAAKSVGKTRFPMIILSGILQSNKRKKCTKSKKKCSSKKCSAKSKKRKTSAIDRKCTENDTKSMVIISAAPINDASKLPVLEAAQPDPASPSNDEGAEIGPLDLKDQTSVAQITDTLAHERKSVISFSTESEIFRNKHVSPETSGLDQQVDDVWYDLVDKHDRLLASGFKDDELKHQLRRHYLHNMHRILQGRTGHLSTVPTEPGSVVPNNDTQRSFLNKDNKGLQMHRQFFLDQMEYLRTQSFRKSVDRLAEIIITKNEPQGHEDLELLQEYARDPQRYNSHLISSNEQQTEPEQEAQLSLIEGNFEKIMRELERASRRKKILQMSAKRHSQSNVGSQEFVTTREDEFMSVLNSANIKALRAKWSKYFANLEKSPIELQLASVREQRQRIETAKKAELQKKRNEQRKMLRDRRSLTELYTAPRLTHRMRQVLEERAKMAKARVQSQLREKRASEGVLKTTAKPLSFADAVAQTMSQMKGCNDRNLFRSSVKNNCKYSLNG